MTNKVKHYIIVHMNTPIQQLERSYGNFPREHQFSTLEDLERGADNPELDVFLMLPRRLLHSGMVISSLACTCMVNREQVRHMQL